MSLRHFPPTNCNVEDDPLTTTVPTGTHSLTGRDSESERPPEYSPTDTLGAVGASQATPNSSYSKPVWKSVFPHFSFMWLLLVYYRIYAEDGAIPSKTRTLVAPSDPFLGRIKVRSVPPPRTVKAVKRSITKVENIKDHESTTIFLTPYSQSPMDDAEKVTILNGIGPGSTPQDPLALVAKMSDSERTVLESDGTVGLANPAESEIRYGTSIQYFPFPTISTVEGTWSLLSALRRWLRNSIQSSQWSRGAIPWSYSCGFYCASTYTHDYQTMHFESGEKPSTFLRWSFRRHIMRYSIDGRTHLNPSHWWPRPESERANGHRPNASESPINLGWEVCH